MKLRRSYYTHAIEEVQSALKAKHNGVTPAKDECGNITPGHILWMCAGIEEMNTWSLGGATRAGRWIGWILLAMEQLGFWDNNQSRAHVRMDVEVGNDLPYPYRICRKIRRHF